MINFKVEYYNNWKNAEVVALIVVSRDLHPLVPDEPQSQEGTQLAQVLSQNDCPPLPRYRPTATHHPQRHLPIVPATLHQLTHLHVPSHPIQHSKTTPLLRIKSQQRCRHPHRWPTDLRIEIIINPITNLHDQSSTDKKLKTTIKDHYRMHPSERLKKITVKTKK